MIVAPGLRSTWKKRLIERAERAAMKEREADLKEAAKKEKEVPDPALLYFDPITCVFRKRDRNWQRRKRECWKMQRRVKLFNR